MISYLATFFFILFHIQLLTDMNYRLFNRKIPNFFFDNFSNFFRQLKESKQHPVYA